MSVGGIVGRKSKKMSEQGRWEAVENCKFCLDFGRISFSASEWRDKHTLLCTSQNLPTLWGTAHSYTKLCPLNNLQDSLMTTTSSAGIAVIEWSDQIMSCLTTASLNDQDFSPRNTAHFLIQIRTSTEQLTKVQRVTISLKIDLLPQSTSKTSTRWFT